MADEATGTAFRLNPGEAPFTPDGVVQRRMALGPDPVAYPRIGVAAAASAGTPFALPKGRLTFARCRIVLDAGATSDLPAAVGERLVLVEQGSGTLETATGREDLVTTVGSDTAYAIRSAVGAVRLTDVRMGMSVLVTTIA